MKIFFLKYTYKLITKILFKSSIAHNTLISIDKKLSLKSVSKYNNEKEFEYKPCKNLKCIISIILCSIIL